jgi:hypothetical protein
MIDAANDRRTHLEGHLAEIATAGDVNPHAPRGR